MFKLEICDLLVHVFKENEEPCNNYYFQVFKFPLTVTSLLTVKKNEKNKYLSLISFVTHIN